MDLNLKEKFLAQWQTFFDGAELPIAFFYAAKPGDVEVVPPPKGRQCFIGVLSTIRKGASLAFDVNSLGCAGGKRYLGFSQELRPNFEFFLSCGIPGEMEGERYKKTPELVRQLMAQQPKFVAPADFIIFKRWDRLEPADHPDVVIFFARPDVLSALFVLSNFEEADPHGVMAPFSSGCGAIVQYPYLEKNSPRPRAVLGMFDISARPFVPADTLTLAVPMGKFARMVADMEESFLTTHSWAQVKKRLG